MLNLKYLCTKRAHTFAGHSLRCGHVQSFNYVRSEKYLSDTFSIFQLQWKQWAASTRFVCCWPNYVIFCLALSPIFILILKEAARAERQTAYSSRKKAYICRRFFFLLMCFVKLAKNWFTQVLWLAGSPKSVDWGTLGPKRQTKAVLLISRLSAALGSQTNSACRFRWYQWDEREGRESF